MLSTELDALMAVGPERTAQLLAGVISGVLFGIDRRAHGSAVGVRTCTLVCLGAVLYTHVGVTLYETTGAGDPSRMPGQIVTGIGFLGAGAILHVGGNVQGLTSAAVVWFLGAIGVVIGSGYPMTALFSTIAVVLLLRALRLVEGQVPTPDDTDGNGHK